MKNENKIKLIKKSNKKNIPIIFAADNNFAPYLVIALESMLSRCNNNYNYKIHILQTDICDEYKALLNAYVRDNVSIQYVNVTAKLDKLGTLPLRDYYTHSIYYRLFIPALFPQYKKALYLDCDIILKDDISKLYNSNISNQLLGVVSDDILAYYDIFGQYAEKTLGINRYKYFNSGILVMNLEKCRKYRLECKFVSLLNKFKFIVAPDQDYLNVLCKDRVVYLDRGWNKTPLVQSDFDESTLKLIHYKMGNKPWQQKGLKYEEYFWESAKKTPLYQMMLDKRADYEKIGPEKDKETLERLVKTATDNSNDPNNYFNTIKKEYMKAHNLLSIDNVSEMLSLNITFDNNDDQLIITQGV